MLTGSEKMQAFFSLLFISFVNFICEQHDHDNKDHKENDRLSELTNGSSLIARATENASGSLYLVPAR